LLSLIALVSCSRDPNVAKKRYVENGNKYFDKAKYKEASIMYRNALKKDLRYGEAHYRLGLTELKLGRLVQGVGAFRRAVELISPDQPNHWDATVRLAELYLSLTREKQYMDEVDGFVKGLLKRDANSYDGHRLAGDLNFVNAQLAFRKGDKEKEERAKDLARLALAEYQKADALKGGQTGVYLQMARTHAALGDAAEAERIYRVVMDKEKNLLPAYTELYQFMLFQNKPEVGENVLKLAVANNPKQWGFLTLLAAHYYTQRRREDMVSVLSQIKSHAHEWNQAYLTVGDFYLRMAEGDEAIRQYREGIANDAKQKLQYQKRIIETLMRQGKPNEAAEMGQVILKENPNDNDVRGLQAAFLLDRGDVVKALAELQAVVTRAPENPVARFHLGRAHAARQEWEQARQQFQKAIELRADYVMARRALAELQVVRREFDAALKSVQDILQIDRQNVSARLIESAAYMGMRRFGDARQLLQNLLAANASSPEVLFQLGVVDLAESRFKEAEEHFRKSFQLNPANPRGLMGMVEVYLNEKKPEQAMQLLQTEVDKAPTRLDFRLALGNTAVRAGKYDLAVTEFNKILGSVDAKSRTAGDLYIRLGETYRRKGDWNNSIAALQKAREIMPDNPIVMGNLAVTLDVSGRKQEARQVYEATIKMDPSNGVALNNLAFLMAENGADLDQALTLAQRAKQILQSQLEISDTLGWIYLKKNLSDNAIEIFKDLVAKQPGYSTYRYHLGMALSQKGDKPKALKELQEALKCNPPKDELAKIKDLIAKLG
jgi:tetratricopeptide (TPR) repeat protein